MTPVVSHPWSLPVAEAEALQRELAARVVTWDRLGAVKRVAGVDVAYDGDRVYAAAVVLDAETLAVIDAAEVEQQERFPYVPGLLSFRELPPVAAALGRLKIDPDLVVCDGQGLAHPRRFGLACHLGVLFDVPCIGCAKKRLLGRAPAPGRRRGSHRRIVHRGEVVGEVLRTQDGVQPVFVSIGHRLSLPTARALVLRLAPTYRLPETTREANRRVNEMRARAG